jgi:hypothetical protein
MRRLSIDSSTSSFSIISDAPSVQSLDTNGSVNGGVAVDPPSLQVLESSLNLSLLLIVPRTRVSTKKMLSKIWSPYPTLRIPTRF